LDRARFFLMITDKWHIKVLSLAAAVIISIFYRMNNLETRYFTVPLTIESNENLIPINYFLSSVRISLRGESVGIRQIVAEDIEAYIDLTRYDYEGNYKVPVQIRKKGGALGVEPLEITVLPIEIPLSLEQKIARNVNVFPVLSGTVADGYELTDQSLNPSSVTVDGPRSILNGHIEFNTETIDLDNRYDDFSVILIIKNNNPLLSIRGSNTVEFKGTISRIHERETPIAVPRRITTDEGEEQ